MRKIEVVLERNEYIPSETIKGILILECNEKTEFEKIELILYGNLTQILMVIKKRSHSSVRSAPTMKGYPFYEDKISLLLDTEFDEGYHEIPFHIQLPEDLAPSFSGENVGISYNLRCIAILRGKNSEESKFDKGNLISILSPIEKFPNDVIVASDDGNTGMLEIKANTQRLCVEKGYSFQYKIDTDSKFKEMQIELETTTNFVDYTGNQKRQFYSKLLRTIPFDEAVLHKWRGVQILPSTLARFSKTPVTVSSTSLKSDHALKVTIVKRMKRGKITARIPLYIGHCLESGWREEKQRKYGDSLNLSLRAIPWTRSRPIPTRKRIEPRVVFECIDDSDKNLSEKEKQAIHWYNKAVLFRMEKLEKEALQFVEKSLELNPNLSEAITLRDHLVEK